MNPARVFALQAQKSSDALAIAGGITEVDQAIAAGLCAGMRREHYLAGRLKWSQDWSVANELEHKLWLFAVDVSNKERWNLPKGKEMLRKMAGLAIAEMADPARYRYAVAKADWMGIHSSNFARTWEKRYNLIYQELDDLASRAFSHVMMRQRYAEIP